MPSQKKLREFHDSLAVADAGLKVVSAFGGIRQAHWNPQEARKTLDALRSMAGILLGHAWKDGDALQLLVRIQNASCEWNGSFCVRFHISELGEEATPSEPAEDSADDEDPQADVFIASGNFANLNGASTARGQLYELMERVLSLS